MHLAFLAEKLRISSHSGDLAATWNKLLSYCVFSQLSLLPSAKQEINSSLQATG